MNTAKLSPAVLLPWMILPFLALINFIAIELYKEEHQENPQEGSGLMTELPEAEESEIEGKFQAFKRQFKGQADDTFLEELSTGSQTELAGDKSRYTAEESTRLDSLRKVWDRAMRPAAPQVQRSPQRIESRQALPANRTVSPEKVPEDSLTKERDSVEVDALKVKQATTKKVFFSEDMAPAVFHGAPVGSIDPTGQGVLVENQTVQQGDRVRIQLTSPLMVGEDFHLPTGTLLAGRVDAFSGERVQITISSVTHQGQIIPVKLGIQDTDGGEGLFVPQGNFVEITQDMGSNFLQALPTLSTGSDPSLLTGLAGDLMQQGSRSSSRILSKAARRNKAMLLAGTIVVINPK